MSGTASLALDRPSLLLAVYLIGVVIGLLRIDARLPGRIGLALLWPLGPLAFVITVSILLLASLIAFPILGAIVLAGGLAAAAFAQTAPAASTPIEARFIGNMAIALTDGQTTIFTDFPYESGYSVYMEYDPREIRSSTERSFSLITHRHGDHWNPALFAKTNWKAIGPEDAFAGVAPGRVERALPVKPTPATFTVNGIGVEALPTPHANIGHYSYLVTWDALRLYFTGDTDDASALLAARNLDVAFVSPWLYQRVQKSGRRIDARRVVIYHQTADTKSVPGCTGSCRVPAQGETLRLR